jgi:ribosome biogenesis GTPase
MSTLLTGTVIRTDAKVCHVDLEGRVIQAAPRGILFGSGEEQRSDQKNPVAVGDRVEVDLASQPASLEKVLPRRNWLSRTASSHDPREQVLAANVDQLFVVSSVQRPGFSSNRTDRILAACVWGEIPAVLIVNKIDLSDEEELGAIRKTYEQAGVPVLFTCALDGRGIDELRAGLEDKVTVLYGASGSGKSSLLNTIEPGLKLKVGKISKYWETGKHTTSYSQLHRLSIGGAVIDTPGIRVFRLYGVPAANLRDLFREFAPFQAKCKFPDCTHDHEPECAVFEAVERGGIAASRFASYVELLDEARKVPLADDADEGGDEE